MATMEEFPLSTETNPTQNQPGATPDQQPEAVSDSPEIGEFGTKVNQLAGVALRGIARVAAGYHRIMMERAGSTMESMEHRNALYHHVGRIAAPSYAGELHARPVQRTSSEARHVKNIEKKQFELGQAAKAQKKANSYGGRGRDTGWKARAARRERESKIERDFKNGILTPEQRRAARQSVASRPVTFENTAQKKARKRHERARRAVIKSARQPFLERWQLARRAYAIESIQQHEDSMERWLGRISSATEYTPSNEPEHETQNQPVDINSY